MTRQQQVLLAFLRQRSAEGGPTPSLAEMAEALGIRSKGSVHRLLLGLEERGRVRRLAYRARTVEIVDPPQDDAAALIAAVLHHPVAEMVEHAHPGWRSRARTLLELKAAVVSIALLLPFAAPAPAHDWMPAESRWCCDDRDCRPIGRDAVERTPEGWRIRATGQLFPDGAFGLYPNYAPDRADAWICQIPAEARARCLFVLPEGS